MVLSIRGNYCLWTNARVCFFLSFSIFGMYCNIFVLCNGVLYDEYLRVYMNCFIEQEYGAKTGDKRMRGRWL